MTNAKAEFLAHVGEHPVQCAEIQVYLGKPRDIRLPVGYTLEQYEAFLTELEFEYDSGYGGQRLFGTIWYCGSTWSKRGEYDGSEWWELCRKPITPKYLRGKK